MLLNVDVGEESGCDEAIIPLADLANIACGGHAGDERTMAAALRLARMAGVGAGAHPGYEDRLNFGRRSLPLSVAEVVAMVDRQLATLVRIARREGIALGHVKLHGALYHDADRSAELAGRICRGVAERMPGAAMIVPPGGEMERACEAAGVKALREGFADRRYGDDGRLLDRSLPGAVIEDPALAATQARGLAGRVDTLCVHGDSPHAEGILRAVRAVFSR